MKKKTRIWFYLIPIIGVLYMLTNSCKKIFEDREPLTLIDVDGNVYDTVTIGSQLWMVEDLKVTHYRNGDPIPNVTDNTAWSNLTTGAYCDYNNNPDSSATYGRLYNWYVVNDKRNIAPVGWHVPSDHEWTNLINYLGGEFVAGGKMKEAGTIHWSFCHNIGATNESGFTALPGGSRSSQGVFQTMNDDSYWWSTMAGNYGSAKAYSLFCNGNGTCSGLSPRQDGYSVRCVRN